MLLPFNLTISSIRIMTLNLHAAGPARVFMHLKTQRSRHVIDIMYLLGPGGSHVALRRGQLGGNKCVFLIHLRRGGTAAVAAKRLPNAIRRR
jgi:hypothetical protein